MSFWYDVQLMVNGKAYQKSFQAPRVEVGSNNASGAVHDFEGMILKGSYNPRIVDGKLQLSVEIDRK
jgi:hypothetical protein